MPFNGSGTFTRLYNWTDDAANGIKIRADRMDAEMDGFATGLTDCVTRDGQSAATADLPMGGFKHTNVDDATDPAHYASAKQAMNDLAYCGTVDGTANAITIDSAIAPTALVAGQRISFFAASDNTDAVTLNRNSLGAKSLLLNGAALTSGQIKSGYLYMAVYDGTQWNLLSASGIGTAAAKNIGTSGDTVPLCSGSITWSGTNKFSGSVRIGSGDLTSAGEILNVNSSAGNAAGIQLLQAGSANWQIESLAGVTLFGIRQSGTTWLTLSATGALRLFGYGAGTLQSDASGNITASSASTMRSSLGLASGATTAITVSASAPSGGSNGDLWFQT